MRDVIRSAREDAFQQCEIIALRIALARIENGHKAGADIAQQIAEEIHQLRVLEEKNGIRTEPTA